VAAEGAAARSRTAAGDAPELEGECVGSEDYPDAHQRKRRLDDDGRRAATACSWRPPGVSGQWLTPALDARVDAGE